MSTTLTNPYLAIAARAVINSGTFPVLSATTTHTPAINLVAGSTSGSVNAVIEQNFTVTSGTPLTINVATGLDPFGNAAGMVHVSTVLVENDSTTAGQDFTIGGGTHPVLGTDSYLCQANGGVVTVCNPAPGYTVSSGSADTLTITVAAGTAVAGKLTIFGRTA
jgi:hypothetical protein